MPRLGETKRKRQTGRSLLSIVLTLELSCAIGFCSAELTRPHFLRQRQWAIGDELAGVDRALQSRHWVRWIMKFVRVRWRNLYGSMKKYKSFYKSWTGRVWWDTPTQQWTQTWARASGCTTRSFKQIWPKMQIPERQYHYHWYQQLTCDLTRLDYQLRERKPCKFAQTYFTHEYLSGAYVCCTLETSCWNAQCKSQPLILTGTVGALWCNAHCLCARQQQ